MNYYKYKNMIKKLLFLTVIAAFIFSFLPIENALAFNYYNANPEYVWYWDGTSFRSQTGLAESPELGGVYLGNEGPPKSSAIYITMGYSDFSYANTYFDKLKIQVTQPGIAGNVIWEYYADPGGWLPLDVYDETDAFKNSGWGEVSWNNPANWGGTGVNGRSGLWVRARTTSNYSQVPLANLIEVLAYNLYVKVLDNTGAGFEGLGPENFVMSELADNTVYGVRERGNGIYELAVVTKGVDLNGAVNVSIPGWESPGAIATGSLSKYVVDLTNQPFEMTKMPGPSPYYSEVTTDKGTVLADGTDSATITVTVNDADDYALEGVNVVLASDHDAVIIPGEAATAQNGKAYFTVTSETPGRAVFTATANGVEIEQTAEINFASAEISPGTLVKLYDDGDPATPHDSAVYYLAADGKRYVFPNAKVYESWYSDFSGVVEISGNEMAELPIGGNVTYRPGERMLKIQSDPKTYAVDIDATLRWIENEEIAAELYGADWNTRIDDVDITYWVDYSIGEAITDSADFSPSAVMESVQTINENLGLYD